MSAPAVALAFKVAAGAFAAYNVVKGLKEGNLMQAVLGGVSAYFAFSGLGAATATQAAAGAGAPGVANQAAAINNTLGGGAATTVGTIEGAGTSLTGAFEGSLGAAGANTGAFGELLGEGAGLQAGNLAASGTGQAAGAAAGTALESAGGGWLSQAGQSAFDNISADNVLFNQGAGGAAGPAGGDSGFLSGISDWAEANPELASEGVKTAGNMLSGWAQGQQQEELYRRQLEEAEKARRRRGAATNPGSLYIRRAGGQ